VARAHAHPAGPCPGAAASRAQQQGQDRTSHPDIGHDHAEMLRWWIWRDFTALCLVTAAAMLIMISPAIDEVVAMGQFLVGARREGKPFWHTFWVGGTLEQYRMTGPAESPATTRWQRRSPAARVAAALDLKNVPWTLLISAALGVWLMAAPAVLGVGGPAADSQPSGGRPRCDVGRHRVR
jgi:hypothetical protein